MLDDIVVPEHNQMVKESAEVDFGLNRSNDIMILKDIEITLVRINIQQVACLLHPLNLELICFLPLQLLQSLVAIFMPPNVQSSLVMLHPISAGESFTSSALQVWFFRFLASV